MLIPACADNDAISEYIDLLKQLNSEVQYHNVRNNSAIQLIRHGCEGVWRTYISPVRKIMSTPNFLRLEMFNCAITGIGMYRIMKSTSTLSMPTASELLVARLLLGFGVPQGVPGGGPETIGWNIEEKIRGNPRTRVK
jgi:hypothetical protein